MNILKFILFLGLLSQIYAQLDPNYWRIENPRTFSNVNLKILEVRPSTLKQQQWDWSSDNYWQYWIIYWTDKPNREGIVFDRYNYRALTAVNGKLEAQEIYSINDPRNTTQIWKGIGQSTTIPALMFNAPYSKDVGIPWDLTSDYFPQWWQLSTLKENLDTAKYYKILSWSNPLRSLDLAGFVPYVWDTNNDYDNYHQRFILTEGICNNQPAYQIANANNRYLIAGGQNRVLTLAIPAGKSPKAADSVTWWFLNKEPDYYNLAYTISNCVFPDSYLTLPDDFNTNAKEFKMGAKGEQGIFFLRKML